MAKIAWGNAPAAPKTSEQILHDIVDVANSIYELEQELEKKKQEFNALFTSAEEINFKVDQYYIKYTPSYEREEISFADFERQITENLHMSGTIPSYTKVVVDRKSTDLLAVASKIGAVEKIAVSEKLNIRRKANRHVQAEEGK